MARQVQQLNYTSFTGGIITEASPLTFPDGASIDENNFELTKQGFRRRRLGLDMVSDEVKINGAVSAPKDVVTYLWDNNGSTDEDFLVVAIKNELLIYSVADSVPGDDLVYQTTIAEGNTRLSIASRSNQLIVANGQQDLTIIRYLGNNLFSERKERLRIRDRAGIPDYYRDYDYTVENVSLLNAENAGYRPTGNELYIKPAFPKVFKPDGDDPLRDDAVDPIQITFNFVSKTEAKGGSASSRYYLETSNQYDSFMGYPIESFILEKTESSYKLNIIFKESFFKQSITANGQTASSYTLQDNGIKYSASLTLSEYNSFFNLSSDLKIVEDNAEFHPHIYNLWNQGWGDKRMHPGDNTSLIWPIDIYHSRTGNFPANADNINSALYPNSAHASNRTADRIHWQDLEANPQGSSVAPQGRFIIDALDRGKSRNASFLRDVTEKEYGRYNDTEMSFERTSKGCTTVAEYAGRMWYAGFSGDSAGSTIPMSNKILYGQVDEENLLACYQEADPTSKDDSDLVDTDGGWVTIEGLDEVVKLVATDTSLVVFATNGVWVIAGIDGNTFSPTASMVSKITDKGSVNSQNIVQVDTTTFFWAKDGLYQLSTEGFASFKLDSLSKNSINEIVVSLSEDDFLGISGAYDERTDRIVWLIDGRDGITARRELVLHLAFGSFTINTYYQSLTEEDSIEILSVVRTPQFESSAVSDNIVAGVDNVVAGSDNVVASSTLMEGKSTRVSYLTVRNASDGYYISFSNPVRLDFKDWGNTDAEAFLLTGYVTGGDTSREKQVPYLTIHCNRTEENATETGVERESSCMVQSQWTWTNDAFAGKWGPAFQAYRLGRPQISGIGQPVALGEQVVTTKNKLRGRGKTVSLLFSTEEEKDCQLLGWSMIAAANSNI